MSDLKLDVRVYPIDEPKNSTLALASVAVNDMVAIQGIRVIDSDSGAFVSMPQSYDKAAERYNDIAFPVTGELRKAINEAVLEEYEIMANLPPEKRGYEKPDMTGAKNINAENIKLNARVYLVKEPKNNTKAFAEITVDDLVAIRGVHVIEGKNEPFVSMPQTRDKYGEYKDVAFPINGDLRKEISRLVLEKYEDKAPKKITNKSLADGLRKGAEKAARQNANAPKETAAKSRYAGALE